MPDWFRPTSVLATRNQFEVLDSQCLRITLSVVTCKKLVNINLFLCGLSRMGVEGHFTRSAGRVYRQSK